MIPYKKISIEDKQWIDPLLRMSDLRGCHQNFTNLFSWSEINHYQIARFENRLIVKAHPEGIGVPYYFYPAGSGNIIPAIAAMQQDALSDGHDFVMEGLSKANVAELQQLFADTFEFTAQRDYFDYIYFVEKLASLSGKKLHAKRNHINYFKKNFTWHFELISAENLAECREMNRVWCIQNKCFEDGRLSEEYCAVKRCFDYYDALGLEGALLRKDGEVIAYTMGEKLNSNTYVIHIEKAFSDIRGSYQMINREFAEVIHEKYPEILYMNREEDVGQEGLRKAKLSYYPDDMEEKYQAKLLVK